MTSWATLILTEKDIERLCGPSAFTQGDLFERGGHVMEPAVLDESLTGMVRGHWRRVDRVSVTHDQKNILTSTCSCAWGPLCRHAAALMLLWLRHPAAVTRPRVEAFDDAYDGDEDLVKEWLDAFGTDVEGSPIAAETVLQDWLNFQPLTTLRTIATYWDVKLPGTKAAAVAKLRATMNDPDSIRSVLAALDADARAALDVVDLLASGGTSTYQAVQRAVSRIFGQSEGSHTSPALRRLYDRGLVISVGDRWGNAESLLLPPVADQLDTVTGPIWPQPVTADVGSSPGLTLSDVFVVLVDAIQSRRLVPAGASATEGEDIGISGWHTSLVEGVKSRSLLETHLALPLPVVDEESLTEIALTVGWPADVCEIAFRLLLVLGVVRTSGSHPEPQYLIDPVAWGNVQVFPAAKLLPICVAGWIEAGVGIELRRLLHGRPSLRLLWHPLLREGEAPELYLPDVMALRDLLMRLMERLPAPTGSQWYEIAELHTTLWRLNRTVLGSDTGSRRTWWFATHPGGDLHLDRRADWDRVVAPLLDIIVTGPMRALGLVEVAQAPDHRVLFRPTPLTGRLSRGVPVVESKAAPWRAWRERDHILINVPTGDNDANARRLMLSLMRFDTATLEGLTYRVGRDTLGYTLNLDWTLESVTAELEQQCGALPDDVRSLLQQWSSVFGEVRLYDEVSLIETEDELLLQELLRTTTVGDAMVCMLSPRVAVVKSARVPDLMRDMERLGHAPRLLEGS